MNTFEIDQCLSHIKSFNGTFPCNAISLFIPGYYVINTAPLFPNATSVDGVVKGEHWVAINVKENGTGQYFDSLGQPPSNRYITEFLGFMCPQGYKYSRRMLQNPLSRACGVYCIDFIMQMDDGGSFSSYINRFSRDLEANDHFVVARATCRLSVAQPRLRLNLKTLKA